MGNVVRFDETVNEDREDWLGDQLDGSNSATSPAVAALDGTPADEEHPLHVYALDDAGAVVGGLTGTTWAHWLDIDVLWVDGGHRGEGVGYFINFIGNFISSNICFIA